MVFAPAYQPLYETVLTFVARPEFRSEVLAGRTEYVRLTGEVFEEDRSFEYRVQAFLDWFIFDRPLAPSGEPPVRAYALESRLPHDVAERYRHLGRTVHGLFQIENVRPDFFDVHNFVTGARYKAARVEQVAGINKNDLFEGRLVPFEGAYHFSPAFLFYPAHLLARVKREISRQRRSGEVTGAQELLFTLSRMAGRAEHYRNVELDAIYDFARPPPKIAAKPLRFDSESVAQRLGRVRSLPDSAD
jgi:hypothetical protein